MRTILLIIEFEGTAYAGWQSQINGVAVQDVVEAALIQVLKQEVRIHSSGRTDAGVHARGMAAHFRTESNIPLTAFREGVNSFLPRDVIIRQVSEMPEKFHARYSAKGKWYRYTIYNNEMRSPLTARTAWHLRGSLDLDLIRRAAEYMVGKHDFQAFRTSGCVAKTSKRDIFQVNQPKIGRPGNGFAEGGDRWDTAARENVTFDEIHRSLVAIEYMIADGYCLYGHHAVII